MKKTGVKDRILTAMCSAGQWVSIAGVVLLCCGKDAGWQALLIGASLFAIPLMLQAGQIKEAIKQIKSDA